MKKIACACALAASLGAASASAAPIVLTFEGIGDFAAVGNFYNGGSGGNYGIGFNADSIGLVDSDAGGSGSFGGQPSGSTALYFVTGSAAVMNVAAGFDSRLGFHYTAGEAGFVNIYDGLDGTGNLLASIGLAANTADCNDANNFFCRFDAVELLFGGTARSVAFGGEVGYLAFDDVTLGVEAPSGDVPEPASLALSALGLAGLLAARRRARKG